MRKWRVSLLIFLLVLSLSSVTEAVNWVNLGNGETFTLYVDSESVTDGPNGAKEAWFMLDYNPADCTSNYAKGLNKCVAQYAFLEWHYSASRPNRK